MSKKQENYIAELKTQLTAQGFTTINDYAQNLPVIHTGDNDIFVYAGSTDCNTTVDNNNKETYPLYVLVCFPKTFIGYNASTVRFDNMEKIKIAMFDALENAIAAGDVSFGNVMGDVQYNGSGGFNDNDYISFYATINITVINTYE